MVAEEEDEQQRPPSTGLVQDSVPGTNLILITIIRADAETSMGIQEIHVAVCDMDLFIKVHLCRAVQRNDTSGLKTCKKMERKRKTNIIALLEKSNLKLSQSYVCLLELLKSVNLLTG